MARRRGGGFGGGGGFASGKGPNANDPVTEMPARGAAARPNRIGRRDDRRDSAQGRRQTQRDRRDNPLVNEPAGGGDQLGTAAGSIAFNDVDNLELGAWGVLNNAGISRDPGANAFGGNAIPWLENRVSSWVDQHRGNVIVNDKNATFEDALSRHAGLPGTAPGVDPGDPLAFKPWLKGQGINKKIQKMGKTRRKNLRGQYGTYADEFGSPAGDPLNVNAAPMSPEEQALMRQTLTRDWAAATPQTRGYRSSDYIGNKRTIQFAISLFSAGAALVEILSRVMSVAS